MTRAKRSRLSKAKRSKSPTRGRSRNVRSYRSAVVNQTELGGIIVRTASGNEYNVTRILDLSEAEDGIYVLATTGAPGRIAPDGVGNVWFKVDNLPKGIAHATYIAPKLVLNS